MKSLLFVSLLVLATFNVTLSSNAQTPVMQQGVSVQMAVTNNAQPAPAADDQDAWVIAVTADGKLFFGVHRETSGGLLEQMKINPRRRDQNVYIKADARSPFGDVKKALQAARLGGFNSPVLLTVQRDAVQPGVLVSPKGLPVLLSPAPSPGEAALLQIHGSANEATAEINGQSVAWNHLQSALAENLQARQSEVIVVQADDQLWSESVAQAIDLCQSVGVKVVLPTPTI